jgi:hypothetical protein
MLHSSLQASRKWLQPYIFAEVMAEANFPAKDIRYRGIKTDIIMEEEAKKEEEACVVGKAGAGLDPFTKELIAGRKADYRADSRIQAAVKAGDRHVGDMEDGRGGALHHDTARQRGLLLPCFLQLLM